jgi:SAM-dependent methyltransferase
MEAYCVVDVREYFDKRSGAYGNGNWKRRGLFPEEVAAIEALPADVETALDLGSGPGVSVPALASRARHVIGVDLSPGMLALRRHRYPVLISDGIRLPFKQAALNVVLLRMSAHYFDLSRLCDELSRVLKRPGSILVSSIFPYGQFDEVWFNERHQIKGKPNVYTLTVDETVKVLEPHFRLAASRAWTSVNSLDESITTNPDANSDRLRSHALEAPTEIKDLYQIQKQPDGAVSLTVKWAILTFSVL